MATKYISVIAWGCIQRERRALKGLKESFGGDGNVIYLDLGSGFIVYIYQG